MSRQLGLIIGINQYQDSTFRPLQCAENDARALAQWLVNNKGGNWTPANVQLLQGSHGTYELVQSLIAQLCVQMTNANDLILIYFAGHAFVDDRSGEGYLALTNTRPGDPSTAISLSLLVDTMMAHSPASQILVILDCMQNGQRWSMQRSFPSDFKPLFGPVLLTSLQQQRDRLLLCSCRGNDILPESGEQSLGVFARRMIVGLCGPAIDPANASVTLQSLTAFMSNMSNEQQRPQLFGQPYAPLLLTGAASASGASSQTQSPPTAAQQVPVFAPAGIPNPAPGAANAMPQYQPTPYATATAQLSPSAPDPRVAPPAGNEELQRQQIAQMMSQAQQYAQMQGFGEALNLLAGILRMAPQNVAALTLQSQLLSTMGRTQEAIASVEQIMNLDPANSASWSLRAVLLSNAGQYQAALSDIERSLELNPNNPETYALKTNIMSRLASMQHKEVEKPHYTAQKKADPYSFFLGAILQMVSFITGIGGLILLVLRPTIPMYIGLVLASLALAILIVNSTRGSYRYGIVRFLFTAFICLLAGGVLATAYRMGAGALLSMLRTRPSSLVPLLFLAVWLALAATLPLLLGLMGFLIGLPARMRSRKTA